MGDMALGDIVVTINPLTGRASASEVKEIRRGTVDALVRFDTEDGAAVRTSLTQPLIAGLMDRDGTKASALEVGNTLVSYGEDLEALAAENTLIAELQIEEGEFPVSILGLRNVDHSFVARLPEAASGVACHNIAVKL
jgi:molybdopterin-binding protein